MDAPPHHSHFRIVARVAVSFTYRLIQWALRPCECSWSYILQPEQPPPDFTAESTSDIISSRKHYGSASKLHYPCTSYCLRERGMDYDALCSSHIIQAHIPSLAWPAGRPSHDDSMPHVVPTWLVQQTHSSYRSHEKEAGPVLFIVLKF